MTAVLAIQQIAAAHENTEYSDRNQDERTSMISDPVASQPSLKQRKSPMAESQKKNTALKGKVMITTSSHEKGIDMADTAIHGISLVIEAMSGV